MTAPAQAVSDSRRAHLSWPDQHLLLTINPPAPSSHRKPHIQPTPAESGKEIQTDIESNFSPVPAQRGGAETEMGAGCNGFELDARLGVFHSGLMYGSVLFLKLASVALPD